VTVTVRPVRRGEAGLVLDLVRGLAEYEKLAHEVEASEEGLAAALFAESPRVFCEIGEVDGRAAGFALWFYSFSTFRGRHGIYLEDLFVRPEHRGAGVGKALLVHLVQDGSLVLDTEEEITAGVLVTHGGKVVQAATAKLLEPAPAAGGAS